MSRYQLLSAVGIVALFVGCTSSTTPEPVASEPSPEASKYFLTEEPAETKSIISAKESAKDGDEVTLVGRIGGSEAPFIAGKAAFTIVDLSLKSCDVIEGDSCPTPWDYCCATDMLPKATAMVKIVDGAGETLAMDAKGALGMKELQTVVVRGKAKRDEAGNLTVLSPAVFIRK